MTKIRHDVWQDPGGLTMLCYAGEVGEESRTLLEPDSKIIYSFYADSHFDAMTIYYEFMDWGKYSSEFEIDKVPYDLIELGKRQKLRTAIDKILWEEWDPLGVNEVAPRDEYQSYVPQILNLVMLDASVDEIIDRLFQIETERIGVFGDRSRCRSVAEKISKANSVLSSPYGL